MTGGPVTAGDPNPASSPVERTQSWAGLAALGIFYGDLGKSPLYTLKTAVQATGGHFTTASAPRNPVADHLDAAGHHLDQVLPVRHERG